MNGAVSGAPSPQDGPWGGGWPVDDIQDTPPGPAGSPPTDRPSRPPDPPELLAAGTWTWRRRPSRRVLTLIAWLVVTACFVVAGDGDPVSGAADWSAEVMTSRVYLLWNVALGLMIAAVITLPFAFRAGLLLALVAGLASVASGDSTPTVPGLIVMITAVTLAGGDVLAVRQQRRTARGWQVANLRTLSGPFAPGVASDQRRRLLAPSVAVAVWGGITLAGGLLAGIWYAADAAAAASFRATAETAVAAVMSNDGWDAHVTIDGVDLRVIDWSGSHPEGESTLVRFDLTTGRAEFVDDVFDPAWTLLLATLVLGLAGAMWGVYLERRRRLSRLLRRGGEALVVHAAQEGGRVLLSPTDADRQAFAALARSLVVSVPADNPLSERFAALLSADDGPPPTTPGSSDDELNPAPLAGRATRARPAVVVGLGSEDDPVVVLLSPTLWAVGRAGVRASRVAIGRSDVVIPD